MQETWQQERAWPNNFKSGVQGSKKRFYLQHVHEQTHYLVLREIDA